VFKDWVRVKHVLIYVESGSISLVTDLGDFHVKSGEALFLPKGCQGTSIHEDVENRMLLFFFDTADGTLISPLKIEASPSHEGFMRESFLSVFEGRESDAMYGYAVFYRFLSILNAKGNVPRKYQGVQRLAEYIQKNYAENHSLAEYASMCLMSESSMRALFREYTGMGIVAYRNRIRLERAEELILAGVPVGEAAMTVGFSSLSFFHRCRRRGTKQENT
jgi:AraC-like DNA-binding protein